MVILKKLTFKLKNGYNIPEMLDKNEINCFTLHNNIYNKVKPKMKIIPFYKFSPDSSNVNILPFVMDTPIIDNLKNNKVFQELDSVDMLRFNDGIYFSDNIIHFILLWMKYQ